MERRAERIILSGERVKVILYLRKSMRKDVSMVSKRFLNYRKAREELIRERGGKCEWWKCKVKLVVDGTRDNMHIHHKERTDICRKVGRGSTNRLADWRKNPDKIAVYCKKHHYEADMEMKVNEKK